MPKTRNTPLTQIQCKNAPPAQKAYKLFDGRGLYLEIMPTGAKYWRMKYHFTGKEKRLALGVYPEISLAEAREKHEEFRKQIRNDIDPSQARKEKKQQAVIAANNTFEVIAHDWLKTNKNRWSEQHAANLLYRLEMDLFPELATRPISQISSPELLAVIRKIEKRGANEIAHRAKQMAGRIFRYAIACGLAENNPALTIGDAMQPVRKGHYAAMEAKELPAFIQKLSRNEQRLYPQTLRAMWLIMLTFVRTSELTKAK